MCRDSSSASRRAICAGRRCGFWMRIFWARVARGCARWTCCAKARACCTGRIGSRSRSRCCSGMPWMRSGRRARLPPAAAPGTRKLRVACIGGGPASLACAAELCRAGRAGDGDRAPRTARRPEHLWRGRIQTARRRQRARGGDDPASWAWSSVAAWKWTPRRRWRRWKAEFDFIFLGLGSGRDAAAERSRRRCEGRDECAGADCRVQDRPPARAARDGGGGGRGKHGD